MSRSRCSTICRLSVTETMWTAGWDAGIEESLRELRLDGNRYLDTGREPEPRHHGKKCTVALTVAFLGLIIAVVVLAVLLHQRTSAALGPMCPACTDGWIGYRGKCYYFSEAKGNWTYSQKHCSSLGASLAVIDTQQDLDFMLRYKGNFDHWIGLWRDPGQPWKWANGTEFNHLFPITADGDCGYLTENGVSSLRCTSERHWICTNPDPFTKAKGG
ncbi:C-type lectin domain family 2 member D-like [Mauremys mutica]|uniref:C-type lectin domain family 2 member D-like n=1 Tax=Mauremys mutica TaxID=74926 RepID=UPI001D16E51D|nr:C-type lectin domain family 2 member D-like [Mauremys mutica]XP_044838556.1 C-type lectin domain family 2 member D-like [Mauremys mutica]